MVKKMKEIYGTVIFLKRFAFSFEIVEWLIRFDRFQFMCLYLPFCVAECDRINASVKIVFRSF